MSLDSALNCSNRAELKQQLEGRCFDLAIIGGGITGAGIARDAALRGLNVVLLEAQDFASGTSSRSSKMIHGGLRYLVQGDIPVVKESASERAILHSIAPHLATKSPYILTTRSPLESLFLRIALKIYEFLGKVGKEDKHQIWSVAKLQAQEPRLATKWVHNAIVYPEFLTDDARLTLATIRSAKAAGAVVCNYMAVTDLSRDGHFALNAESRLPEDNTKAAIKAKLVVNAAGPWVDQLCQMENPQQQPRLALSRGIHVVVSADRLKVKNTVVMSTSDKRKIFAVPVGDFTYLGTTDEFYPNSDYWPEVYAKDIDYLFNTTNRYFPNTHLSPKDVVSVWSGVRPLVGSTEGKANEISRKDEVWEGPLGMLSIAGGKLSAYRAMAERIVDRAVSILNIDAKPCTTAKLPLPGGESILYAHLAELDKPTLKRWQRLYGSEINEVSALGAGLEAEVRYAVLVEGALRLEDYWARRSSRAWFDDKGGVDSLEPASHVMAELLNWNEDRRQQEINNCLKIDEASRQHIL